MNELIMRWSSEALYESRLVAHNSVSGHTVIDLVNKIEEDELAEILGLGPLLFIDTVGALMYEEIDAESVNESKYNFGECDLVLSVVNELRAAGLGEDSIGVISPYSAQVNEIRRALRK